MVKFKKDKTNLLAVSLIIFLSSTVGAAPIPGTSTSAMVGALSGAFRSTLGFSISAGKSDWILTPPPKNHKYIAVQYKAPQTQSGVQAALTVRVDKLKQSASLKSYVRKWIKDYPKLGFDVLAAKNIKVEGKRAFLLDLLNKASNKQLRQVVFLKNDQAVILTCRDKKDHFLSNLKACNNIIRSFKWSPNPDNRARL